MIKRYSFLTETKAKGLIDKLNLNGGTTSKDVHAIVCLGFQDKWLYDEETDEQILISKGETYNVDVMWVNTQAYGWGIYEVNPKTPNHSFA